MPPDLWARDDIPGSQLVTGDHLHLICINDWGFLWTACQPQHVTTRGVFLKFLIEASRTVEHRKKCPLCYEYWMKRREQR